MLSLREQFEKHAGEIPKIRPDEREKYEAHYALLQSWNENMSLVSPNSIATAFPTHYIDSIHICDFGAKYEKGHVYDLGTGAGFPGIIHAIRYPQKKITLFEKSMKKQSFLMAAITQLALTNVELAGAIPDEKFSGLFFNRAVLPREKLFRFFKVHLQPNAYVVANLGGQSDSGAIPNFFLKVDESQYTLPLNCGNRRVELLQYVPRGI
jgi:16S rRNA (guanine(527)-N(7))-methyltransferase RsmG